MAWLGLVAVFAVIVAAAYLAGLSRREHRAQSRVLHPAAGQIVDPPARYEQVRRVDGLAPYDWQVDE